MDKKIKSSFKNMIIVLTCVCLVSGLALAYIYKMTKPTIEKIQKDKLNNSIKKNFPELNNKPQVDKYSFKKDKNIIEIYPAKKDNNILGYLIKTFSSQGFSGEVWIMVAVDKSGTILNIDVLKHNETPGLGTKMSESKFKDQFKNKNGEKNKITLKKNDPNSDIEAISAATISSNAFCDAINNAFDALKDYSNTKINVNMKNKDNKKEREQ